MQNLKKNYDDYHFSEDVKTDIYNPFSLMNAFSDLKFASYWFSTGTPTFLTLMMRNIYFDYRVFEEGIDVDYRSLCEYRLNSSEPVPMLYQTGYLTIKDYEKEFNSTVRTELSSFRVVAHFQTPGRIHYLRSAKWRRSKRCSHLGKRNHQSWRELFQREEAADRVDYSGRIKNSCSFTSLVFESN